VLEPPDILRCLRLDDHFGTKRWLATRCVFWELKDGAYECESIEPISLESNLRRLVDPGDSSWGLRRFVRDADVCSWDNPLVWHRADVLVRRVVDAVEAGVLVVLRKTGDRSVEPAAKARAEAWRIVSEVDRLTKGRLRSSGRRYTLCTPRQVDRSALGLTRRMLLPREATTILDRMIAEYAAERELVDRLTEAKKFVSRAGAEESELMLLRHLVQPQARQNEQAPVTPSQLRRDKEGWIEIEVFDDLDAAWLGKMKLTLPDGGVRLCDLDRGGFTRIEPIDPGQVEIELLGEPLEGLEPTTDENSSWYEVEIVDERGQPLERVEIEFSCGDELKTGSTAADGKLRVSPLAPGGGTIRFVDPDALLESLESRWEDQSDDEWMDAQGATVLEVSRAAEAWRKPVPVCDGMTARLVLQPPFFVRVLDDAGQPVASTEMTVSIGDREQSVTSDGAGWIEVPLGEDRPESVRIEWDDASERHHARSVALNCNHGDPQAVAWARLRNLGYGADDDMEMAVIRFQLDHGLLPEGLDDAGAIPDATSEAVATAWKESHG
jgi:hypothetical protein